MGLVPRRRAPVSPARLEIRPTLGRKEACVHTECEIFERTLAAVRTATTSLRPLDYIAVLWRRGWGGGLDRLSSTIRWLPEYPRASNGLVNGFDSDAIVTVTGKLAEGPEPGSNGLWLMGSMGSVVGEEIARLATVIEVHPLVLISASCGARSKKACCAMQMAKVSAVCRNSRARIRTCRFDDRHGL